MRILGVDPGYAIVGVGTIDYEGNRFRVVDFGAITTEAGEDMFERLKAIYDEMTKLIEYVINKLTAYSMPLILRNYRNIKNFGNVIENFKHNNTFIYAVIFIGIYLCIFIFFIFLRTV